MQKVNYLKVLTLTMCTLAMGTTLGQTGYEKTITSYRDSIDNVFSNPETSILPEDHIEEFKGIPYYEINMDFRVEATFKPIDNGKTFEMKTTTDRLPKYRPYGTLSFKIDGKRYKLTVYQNLQLMENEQYKNYLFIPFTDETNFETTYSGGRYLDMTIEEVEADEVVIDFNRSYNPYCAYNSRYSCPIPPSENHLKTRIEAGVQYVAHH
ncbi:DUF1684 domain-containing protein [Sanyastnella coralliicola]|uniref:DUF1684 domain-containing protein n=1 Tax=Sanyastnella coralliicola TaxID=3069118 RepID=UPI0027BA6FC0|nr:DUF1684 domain-containing protein [Longitalea sp. SCSIO 12813]